MPDSSGAPIDPQQSSRRNAHPQIVVPAGDDGAHQVTAEGRMLDPEPGSRLEDIHPGICACPSRAQLVLKDSTDLVPADPLCPGPSLPFFITKPASQPGAS